MNEEGFDKAIMEMQRLHHSERMSTIAAHAEALKLSSESLSISILKDVLVPMMMKVFSFFAILVLFLVAAILGVKWALGDLIQITH